MRSPLSLLMLAGLLLLGGCNHNSITTRMPADAASAAPGPQTAPQRLLHLYVASSLPSEGVERNRALAETIALTLRNELRLRGYDVRGAETVAPSPAVPSASGEALAQLTALAHTVAMGTPPPAAARFATYLHPNSPRLLLFIALESGAAASPRRQPELQLGAFLADPVSGDILWSERIADRVASDDQGVRRLAGRLLHKLTLAPPS